MSTIQLGDRQVGEGHACYVIAEVGANHNRDLDVARRLIDAAADAGVDAVKFQTYSGRALYSSRTPQFDYLRHLDEHGTKPVHQLLDELALPREWHELLARHCADRGVHFFSSPFDRAAVDELDALGVVAFKVASFEIVDLDFVRYIASKGRPMIVSTGMCTLGEIDDAVTAAREGGTKAIALLQCASLYPAPPSVMNFRSIPAMAAAFGLPVGLSDHTTGIHLAPAAVALGARLLEKHVTLDRSMSGPDHPFAIEPKELAELVSHVRDVEQALGDGVKRGPSDEEAVEMYAKARRSLVAAVAIPAGTVVRREMLCVKRPGFGIAPKMIDAVVGRTARRDIDFDDVVTWGAL
jgi:sialic acid synthase SpsE